MFAVMTVSEIISILTCICKVAGAPQAASGVG
jgi:hypothetical protein